MVEQLNHLSTEVLPTPGSYRNVLAKTEKFCTILGVDHRFVGGTIADLISPETQIKIDIDCRKVSLTNYPLLEMTRTDGSIKDIDTIFFTKDLETFRFARLSFASWQNTARESGVKIPVVSAEAANHPNWPPKNKLKQFVTSWEVDSDNNPSLNFGSIKKIIQPQSIEPWTYRLEEDDLELTGLNPLGFALCYVLRSPSGVKTKDKTITDYEKVGSNGDASVKGRYSRMSLVMGFANQACREVQQSGVNLKDFHREWFDYIRELRCTNDPVIRAKAAITDWYWKHLGTDVAHGVGALGMLSRFNDQMSG